MNRLALATLLGALLMATAPAPTEPAFSKARLTPEALCFESPVKIDWEAVARRNFKKFPIDKPPEDQLRGRNGEVLEPTFTYSAALPETLKGRHFYLFSETGVRPIVPQRLQGSIRFPYVFPGKPQPHEFSGEVCLPVPKGVQEAGFVATSGIPLTWKKDPALLAYAGSSPRIQLSGGPAAIPGPGTEKAAVEVRNAYLLSSPELGTKYLFIRRATGCPHVCCDFAYDLFRWKAGLPRVAWSAYGCVGDPEV